MKREGGGGKLWDGVGIARCASGRVCSSNREMTD